MTIHPLNVLKLPDGFSLRTGTLAPWGAAALLIDDAAKSDNDEPYTAIALSSTDGGWDTPDIRRILISVASASVPDCAFIMISQSGHYLQWKNSSFSFGHIGEESGGAVDPDSLVLRSVRSIKGLVHAVGMNGVVMRRDADHNWRPLHDDTITSLSLEAIDGFAPDELYVVGWGGAMARFDGRRWRIIDLPTGVFLSNVCCAGDGTVYAIGFNGIVVKGRHDQWALAIDEPSAEELWGVAWFREDLYVASPLFLYRLVDRELELVVPEDDIPATCYHLSTADDRLLSVGKSDVMLLDGSNWRRII